MAFDAVIYNLDFYRVHVQMSGHLVDYQVDEDAVLAPSFQQDSWALLQYECISCTWILGVFKELTRF